MSKNTLRSEKVKPLKETAIAAVRNLTRGARNLRLCAQGCPHANRILPGAVVLKGQTWRANIANFRLLLRKSSLGYRGGVIMD